MHAISSKTKIEICVKWIRANQWNIVNGQCSRYNLNVVFVRVSCGGSSLIFPWENMNCLHSFPTPLIVVTKSTYTLHFNTCDQKEYHGDSIKFCIKMAFIHKEHDLDKFSQWIENFASTLITCIVFVVVVLFHLNLPMHRYVVHIYCWSPYYERTDVSDCHWIN